MFSCSKLCLRVVHVWNLLHFSLLSICSKALQALLLPGLCRAFCGVGEFQPLQAVAEEMTVKMAWFRSHLTAWGIAITAESTT